MNTKERLSLFIEEEGLSNANFERMCGLSNGYVKNSSGKVERRRTVQKEYKQYIKDTSIIKASGTIILRLRFSDLYQICILISKNMLLSCC